MLSLHLDDTAVLRPLEPWNAAEFAAYVDGDRPHLAPWLPWASTIRSTADAAEFLQRYADRQARDEGRIYGIWDAGALVGGTLFRTFDAAAGTCEIGVWLAERAGGRGLVTTAARAMIEWALEIRGLGVVEWGTVPANARSIAVARRLGLHRDHLEPQAFEVNGQVHDVEIWTMTAAAWRTGRAR